MAHATLSLPRPRQKIDPSRIAGESIAIAVHGVLLLLLLAPMQRPEAAAEPERPVYVSRIEPKRKENPPAPPRHVHVIKTTSKAQPQPKAVAPVQVPPLVSEDASPVDTAVPDTMTDAEPAGPVASLSEPKAGAHLEYASAPPPAYPSDALREGATGTVILEVLVGIDGKPLTVTIAESSGNRSLDRAAKLQVERRWRFRPAMQDGQAVQALGRIPVTFNLQR